MKPLTLPAGSLAPTMLEPRNLCLYGMPGLGKSPICATLCRDAAGTGFYLDLQRGTLTYACRRIDILTEAEERGVPYYAMFEEAAKLVRTAKPAFVVVDTIGDLADWADPKANDRFKSSPIGKSWTYKDEVTGQVLKKGFDEVSILDLPGVKGSAGFGKLWEAFQELLAAVMGMHRTIFIGHPKDKIAFATGTDPNVKQNTLVSSEDLDLTGKMRRMFTSKMDAIGFMQRSWEGNRVDVYFQSKDSFSRTRCPHLDGAKLWFSNPCTLAEWARIYPQTLREHLTPEDAKALAPLLAKYEGTPAA